MALWMDQVIPAGSVPLASWLKQATSGMDMSLKLVQLRVNPRVFTKTLKELCSFSEELSIGS